MNAITQMALNAPGCERLKEWVAIGPVQRAAFEEAAELIAAAERNRAWTQAHWTEYERSIAAAEREACAKMCENADRYRGDYFAALIRSRGSV